jgi:hypothetical protein
MDIQTIWNKIQDFLDISGDVWMGIFTSAIVFRTCSAYFGHAPLTAAESAAYASAVTAFAYSNKGTPKS